MNWLARFEITAASWLVIPLAGLSGAERQLDSDPQSKWSSQQEADRMIVHYFDRRVREKAADLRAQYSPERFAQESDKVRRSLRATYLAPSTLWDGQSQLIREATIDGLSLEVRCLKVLSGVYSVLRIYRPPGGSNERHPTVLYLPGHGDPAWDAGVQRRLLGFSKQGYVAVTVDPFGQGELTDTPLWNEYHGCQAMAYLLTAGESLLGIIMASHEVELSYLTSRSDVNPEQLVVMAWPDGRRPDDYLGPTAYTQRAISARLAKLPQAPSSLASARRRGEELKQSVSRLLGASHVRGAVRLANDGDVDIEGATAAKCAVEPEPGVLVPMLAFRPAREGKETGSLYVLLDPEGMTATAASPIRKRLTDDGAWVVCADLRGMGSTYCTQGAYAGLRDQPLCVGALKLGETAAGWWTIDLLAVVESALQIIGSPVKVTVRGDRETGLVAILAASQSQSIDAVETEQLLASYYSAAGYGFSYVYGDAGGHNADLGTR